MQNKQLMQRIKQLILIGLLSIGNITAQNTVKYSKNQLKEDLEYLYSNLQQAHYNLFINTTKGKFDKAYEDINKSLADSMQLMDVYRSFQPFVALSKLGHCTMDYPFGRLYGEYIQNGANLFPFNIQIEKNKAFIKANFSNNDSISKGDELLTVNDIPVQTIINKIYNYLSGESDYFKNTLIDYISFPRLMWIVENTQKNYSISIKDKKGNIKTFTVNSVFAGDFEEKISNEQQVFQDNRIFKIIEDIAYIKPGPFMNALGNGNTSDVNTFDNSEFVHFIDSSFTAISKGKYNNLIIDLRYNSGGSSTFSDEMVAYIANKPFKFCSKFEIKTSQLTKKYWNQVTDTTLTELKKQILLHKDGETFVYEQSYHQPKAEAVKYKGKVYVLINRYSYSQATLTAALIQDYGFGVLIGETTADVSSSYGSIHQFELPHTKIAVSYPKAFVVRPNGDETLKGTDPDIKVETSLFDEKDVILESALKYIKNHN